MCATRVCLLRLVEFTSCDLVSRPAYSSVLNLISLLVRVPRLALRRNVCPSGDPHEEPKREGVLETVRKDRPMGLSSQTPKRAGRVKFMVSAMSRRSGLRAAERCAA